MMMRMILPQQRQQDKFSSVKCTVGWAWGERIFRSAFNSFLLLPSNLPNAARSDVAGGVQLNVALHTGA